MFSRTLFLLCCCFTFQNAFAQNTFWTDIDERLIQADPADRKIIPDVYRTLRLDFQQISDYLLTAPHEDQIRTGASGILLDVPQPDGQTITYEVWASPIMAPELAAQYPDIRTYAGKDRAKKGDFIRFDVTPKGFHAMILTSGRGTVFIDPYALNNTSEYTCYFTENFSKPETDRMVCHFTGEAEPPSSSLAIDDRAGDCNTLRTYRLALACTGEYANYHGATGSNKAPALAAMVVSMNRVNGVFERDCGLRMVIIGNNSDIIYTSPSSDPYTNNDGSVMLGENQTTCDNVIGNANYDIGHVFSTGGGGIAALNSPCTTGAKAQGVTGSPSPVGDPFDIDYVAHEMGHQWGGAHTQYNNCNRSNNSAMEPGSASTIMGYAGICSPNVQNNSDDYFHARSLQQIGTFVSGTGSNCDALVPSGNTAPTVTALSNYTIPISTPFVLTGSATDPNGDPLTYCWEQMNAFTSPAQPMPPQSTNTSGPMFRSFDPVSVPERYFPAFADVWNNNNPTWEELPSVNRTLNFRFTVRDNNPLGGCTAEQNNTVTTTTTSGPFLVTSPNTAVAYQPNSNQTVTWDVANTTTSPVSCANVDILITTNGGTSFSVLAAATPNDGSQVVTMPNVQSAQCRIMVRGTGNVFYDISNVNFSIDINAPAPVELTYFTAQVVGEEVVLEWETATEKNNLGFTIERSADGIQFEDIAEKKGAGNATASIQYRHIDRPTGGSGVFYYRLRQQDIDGTLDWSPIRSVRMANADRYILSFPNPSGDYLYLRLPENALEEQFLFEAWDHTGRLVLSQNYESGNPVNVQHVSAGQYNFRVTGTKYAGIGRFVKR